MEHSLFKYLRLTEVISLNAPRVISHGVPQGSILKPLLFLVYIDDLPLNIQEAKLVLYADDTNMLVTDNNDLQAKIASIMKQFKLWLLKNDLVANSTKTVAVIPSLSIETSL
jgi:retron-type reverse transcriptase